MDVNARIANAAIGLMTGRTPVARNADGRPVSGLCLAQVRIVVEHALFGSAWRFYNWRSRTATGKPRHVTTPWARDMEASLRAAGMALDLPRTGPESDPARYVDVVAAARWLAPGDLAFRWDTAKDAASGVWIGHVGVLLGQNEIIENVAPSYRAARVWSDGPTVLGPLTWPITTIVRFDPDKPPA